MNPFIAWALFGVYAFAAYGSWANGDSALFKALFSAAAVFWFATAVLFTRAGAR